MSQVTYRIGADTSEIVAKLDEVVTAFNSVGKSATATERKVKKTTDTGSKGAKKLETGFISLKEGAEGFGGEMGAVAGRIDKFSKSAAAAGSAMGPWGMGIAAVTLGLGGLAWGLSAVTTAAVEFVDGADDMIDRLGEIAGIEAIPDRTIEQIAEFDRMMVAAEANTKRLQVLIAGELAVALTDIGWAFVGVVQGLQDAAKWADENRKTIGKLVGMYDSLILRRTKLGALFGLFRDVGVSAVEDFADATKEANEELEDLADVEFDPSAFQKMEDQKTKAAEDAAKERAKINKTVEDQLRKDAEESAKETDAELKERLANWKADQEERVRINKEATAQIASDVQEGLDRVALFYDTLETAIKDAVFGAMSATADLVDHFTAKAMEKDQERKDKQLEILAETRGGFRDHLNKIESLEHQLAHERDEERRAQLQREIDAQRKEVDAHKDANKDKRETAKQRAREAHREMVKAFRANKAAQISGVMIDSAAAYMGFLEYFTDKIGPFAPAAAAALVAPATGASIAKIAAEQPPKFHDGVGAVDEMLATLRSGEAVLNQRGAQAAGGSQAIEAMNRGTPPGPTTLVFSYAGRAVERVVLDAMQRGGPLQAAIAGGPAGVANPYRGK